ncbi:sensor histidine kinase [Enterococcus canis]|uniref:sensor histidine kinase n=1 Tax=Enterococcus canis TaxID=214095 RepID=UPI00082C4B69|nr:sensor histidine kinase [Enterococcus canis]
MLDTTLLTKLQSPVWLLQTTGTFANPAAQQFETQYLFSIKAVLKAAQAEKITALQEGSAFPLFLEKRNGDMSRFTAYLTPVGSDTLLEIHGYQDGHRLLDRVMIDYMNEAREKERKKIAQDLHDGIAQSIYSLMLETRNLRWTAPEQQNEHFKSIDRHFSEVLAEIKQIAKELRPTILDDLGLIPALEQLVEQVREQTGFVIAFERQGAIHPLSKDAEVAVYRIVQEAASNAIKYSGVNDARLTLFFQTQQLLISFTDQGRGFIIDQQPSLGLRNMEERAHAIGGTFAIATQLEKGTHLTITVPYQEGEVI